MGIFQSPPSVRHAPGMGLGGTVGGGGGGVGGHFSECVSYLQECTYNGTIFWVPTPFGPWGVAKRSIIIKSQLRSQFQRFFQIKFCVSFHI